MKSAHNLCHIPKGITNDADHLFPFTDPDYHAAFFVLFRTRCTLLLLQRRFDQWFLRTPRFARRRSTVAATTRYGILTF